VRALPDVASCWPRRLAKAPDELVMLAQRTRGTIDQATPALELTIQFGAGDQVGHRIVASRPDSLAKVDGYPTWLRKGAAVIQRNLSSRAEQLDLVAQRVRDRHGPAV